MADPEHEPHPDPDDVLGSLQVPGEVVEKSTLADRRPDVNRLRAVRTGEGTATLYVCWPENSDTLALPARIYEQARAFAQATKREDRLLEDPAVPKVYRDMTTVVRPVRAPRNPIAAT